MQFTQVLTILSLAAGSLAMPNANAELEKHSELAKRTCWELTGNALAVCQKACTIACEAATLGIAQKACGTACSASNLKARELGGSPTMEIEARATTTASASIGYQITDISAITFDTDSITAVKEAAVTTNTNSVDVNVNSAGHTACVVACEVTCNSTILALVQTACLKKCKALCPDA